MDSRQNTYSFENLILEGGGNKGMAYVGVIEELEKAGVMKNIKRLCGASAGSIVAALLAVDFSIKEIREFLDTDIRKIFIDHRFGYFSLLPNLLTGYGWNPGKKILEWFGKTLEEKTGNADFTFKDVYEKYNKELCIVVTNLSQMSTEYMHPKTTPETPIRLAVRMSSSIPVMFQSVWHRTSRTHESIDKDDIYVDGGLLCNYPIHAYDGWWLSMKPEDSFFLRCANLDELSKAFSKTNRFGTWNKKSLGIMLYSESETELMKHKLSERLGEVKVEPPKKSKLYIKRNDVRRRKEKAKLKHKKFTESLERFMKELHRLKFDTDGVIEIKEMREVLEQSKLFTKEDRKTLFDNDSIYDAFEQLDRNGDGKVTFMELVSFAQSKGVDLQTQFLGYSRKNIDSFATFLSTIQEALSINVKRLFVEDKDLDRTIGVDTNYIETTDFELEQCDKEFLLESGRQAALAFLRAHGNINNNNTNLKQKNIQLNKNVTSQMNVENIQIKSEEKENEEESCNEDQKSIIWA